MLAPWLFITVSDESVAARTHLGALLASLERKGGAADPVLVVRGCDKPDAEADRALVRGHPVPSPLKFSPSRARKHGLEYGHRLGLPQTCDQIAFPDDDARYHDGLLERGRVDEYYRGNVAVLAKHARTGGTALLPARRLATGVVLTWRRRLAATAYLRTLADAIALGTERAR